MKKYLPLLLAGLLVLSGVEAAALTQDKTIQQGVIDTGEIVVTGDRDYTHTVLAEEATAVWCQYCPAVATYLRTIYDSGLYDFYYIALVDDMNGYAAQRNSELTITGFPTVVFDGGYRRLVGDYGSTGPYITSLNQCGARTVANIDLEVSATWQGSALLNVFVDLKNNDQTTFAGHVHVYVTEINSRWWNRGVQYHYAMVGNYAINKNINILAGDTQRYFGSWNGNSYGVGDIQQSNIMVIATVFKSGTNYAEETAAATVEDGMFIVDGNCNYQNQAPVNTANVEILNTNTGSRWSAYTNNNYYAQPLVVGTDVNAGDTLRLIAKDGNESVNVTDHIITPSEIAANHIAQNLILNVHYRDLTKFPYYTAQVDSGAMTMKMMMDYLMWNSTTSPLGPPSLYDEQTLFNTYAGGDVLSGDELWNGLNTEVDDYGNGWIYGYFFNPYSSTTVNDVLKQICVWLDFPVNYYNGNRQIPVPKPGHPNHVPIAIPTNGDYNHWMVVRGIHTDRNAWLPPTQLNVYGFWLNDPETGGLSANTYVTLPHFLSTYYLPLNVPGDTYDGKYLAIVDPYQNANVNLDTMTVNVVRHGAGLSSKESLLLQQTQNSNNQLLGQTMASIIKKAAFTQTYNVLKYGDQNLADTFAGSHILGKPSYVENNWVVSFANNDVTFVVHLDKKAALLEFSIEGL